MTDCTIFDTDLVDNTTSMRRLMRWFLLSTMTVGVGVGGWAVTAKVDSAVVTAGTFVVQSSAQAVQHPEGGVVAAILVKNGQLVRKGQALIRLDATRVAADRDILDRRLIDLTAQKARLDAERQDRLTIEPPVLSLTSRSAAADFREALAGEQNLMNERRAARASQLSQLEEAKRQIETQFQGLGVQSEALKEELEQAAAQLKDFRKLEAKQLIARSVRRQSERDVSRLRGQIGDTESRIAGLHSQLAETDYKIAGVTRNARLEILTQLESVDASLAEVEQQRTVAEDRLQRLDIRAPRTGLVHELAIHTVGGVVSPGQKLMEIIPSSEPLIVDAKIRPDQIEQVHIGQKATVRISSFKLAVAPELDGKVTNVSPDQETDERSGSAFFAVQIAVAPGERDKLQGKELTPGLPAEVLIRGESRRVITYLTQPLTEKIGLAFREK